MLQSLIFLFFLSITTFSIAAEDGRPFNVSGEKLEFVPPTGWKLAFMKRNSNDLFAEYIPKDEDIHSWRTGYLSVFRLLDAPTLKEIQNDDSRVADRVMSFYMELANKSCDGENTPMEQTSETINGLYFAIAGYFCERSPTAPFGEGSLFAFIEGKDFLHKIQYSWRPESQADLNNNPPWHIDPHKKEKYYEEIKLVSLCGGDNQPTCKIKYID